MSISASEPETLGTASSSNSRATALIGIHRVECLLLMSVGVDHGWGALRSTDESLEG
jgi:hypothetical protein